MSGWQFLPIGYLASILIETPILLFGLSRAHPWRRRLFAGIWLTACTYPVVILTLPVLFESRGTYLAVAETFAPAAECALFWAAFHPAKGASLRRDMAAITLANLASFGAGELLRLWHILPFIATHINIESCRR
jgi:hypothetical protein